MRLFQEPYYDLASLQSSCLPLPYDTYLGGWETSHGKHKSFISMVSEGTASNLVSSLMLCFVDSSSQDMI